jgi:hypothetical protein
MERIVQLNRGFLELQADRLRSAHELVESALRRHDTRVDEWYTEQRYVVDEDEDPEEKAELQALFEQQKKEALQAYPQLLRASLFATGYGVLEHFLVSICKQCQPHVRGPHLKDLRGEGIIRAQLYLEEVAQVPWPATQEWQDLTEYGLLRNALVHAGGDLSQSDKAPPLEAMSKRVGTFDVLPDRSAISLNAQFNPLFVETVDEFASQLQQATAGHYPSSWKHDA